MSASSRNPAPFRRGIVLLIVVILLALFAVVGLSFMFYAESEANSSRIYREGQAVNTKNVANIDAKELLNYALGQVLYDCRDDGDDLYSALRGHSLGRNKYGWNYTYQQNTNQFDPNANRNTVPFNGLGALRTNPTPFPNLSDYDLPNYQFFPPDNFIRDPERLFSPSTPLARMTRYVGGANVPYTAPDRNNMFLAQLIANDPQTNTPKVLVSSFVRRNPRFGDGTLAPNNPAWFTPGDPTVGKGARPELKYMVLRPRPGDNAIDPTKAPNDPSRFLFPPPEDAGGDVKNLPGARGYNSQNGQLDTNDSFWMDLGYPVQITTNGKKFKPLFAFLILDLDSMLNVNVHGNLLVPGSNTPHSSGQGLGAHEVNLSKLFTNPNEYRQLFQGQVANGVLVPGRFGDDSTPPNPPNPAVNVPAQPGIAYTNNDRAPKLPTSFSPYLMKLDFDASDAGPGGNRALAKRFDFPTMPAAFPSYGSSFDNLDATRSTNPNPQANNPFLSNSLRTALFNDRKPFGYEDLYYMYGTTGTLNSRSDLAKLIPNTLANARFRFQMSTGGSDLDTPGIVPWVDRSDARVTYLLQTPTAAGAAPDPYPNYTADPNAPRPNYVLPQLNALGNQPANSGEFLPNDPNTSQFGAGRAAVLGRLDLNRKLESFYRPDGTIIRPIGPKPDQRTPRPYTSDPFWEAMQQRQDFAREIYDRLVRVTGADPQPRGEPGLNALRYLAQLAANLVDYIDEDDLMTPFEWMPNEFVFGTELPKVVLNEVYAEVRNALNEDNPRGATKYEVNLWLELLNPLPQTNPIQNDPNMQAVVGAGVQVDRAAALLMAKDATTGQQYGAHRILVAKEEGVVTPTALRALDNTIGEISTAKTPNLTLKSVVKFDQPAPDAPRTHVILPSNGQPPQPPPPPGSQQAPNTGFYVLGSPNEPADAQPQMSTTLKLPAGVGVPVGAPTENLTYDLPTNNAGPELPTHTIVLQRLANQWMKPNQFTGPGVLEDPNAPYNPYVTIDYVSNVKTMDAVKFEARRPGGGSAPMHTPQFPPTPDLRESFGRRQPYEATSLSANPQSTATSLPKTTFFQPNSAAQPVQAYDWLVHLDRAPISVAEILHVSGFRPHELTQKFVTKETLDGQERHYGHMAPWAPFDVPGANGYTQTEVNNARIFRALETFTVSDRTYRAFGGRRVGKVNINTSVPVGVPSQPSDTFMALTDPQGTNNYFTQAEVQAVWNQLITRSRTDASGAQRPDAKVGSGALWGAGPINNSNVDPAYPDPTGTGYGVQNTIYSGVFMPPTLSASPTTQPNPYAYFELLTKIQNNITTRSNAFAVFLTVGFFEVTFDQTQPVKLGAEIKNRNGQPTRRRMFAVVDRTNLALDVVDSNPQQVPAQPDRQSQLRQANGTMIRPAVLTSETSIGPASAAPIKVTVAGGDPHSYDPDGKGEDLRMDLGNGTKPDKLGYFPRQLVYVDVGDRQEVAMIQVANPSPNSPSPPAFANWEFILQFMTQTGAPKYDHAAGFIMTNVRLGNPGPQGRINVFDRPGRYDHVVPYALVIE